MNKKLKRGLQACLFIGIIIGFIYIGTKDFTTEAVAHNERFDQEYTNVSSDNVFKYASASDIYTAIKKDAIIFMGYPANVWSGYYANILNEVAKEMGIEEILYYDFYQDRENRNATYQGIVLFLSNYLTTMDDGTQEIHAPTLVIVKNGEIIAYDDETAFIIGNIEPEDYWNEFRTSEQANTFKTMLTRYLE